MNRGKAITAPSYARLPGKRRGTQRGAIATARTLSLSRYAVLFKIPDRMAPTFTDATALTLGKLPMGKRKSLMVDHEKRLACHRETDTKQNGKFFRRPSWLSQREPNKNFNSLLRQFFMKCISFAEVTQEDVDKVTALLNKRPRKCLGRKSPEEVFFNKLLYFT